MRYLNEAAEVITFCILFIIFVWCLCSLYDWFMEVGYGSSGK